MTLGHVNSRNTGSKRVDKEGESEGERGEKRERRRGGGERLKRGLCCA